MKINPLIILSLLVIVGGSLALAFTLVLGPPPTDQPSLNGPDATPGGAAGSDDKASAVAPDGSVAPGRTLDVPALLARIDRLERELAALKARRRTPASARTGGAPDAGTDEVDDGDLNALLAALQKQNADLMARVDKMEERRPLGMVTEDELLGFLDNPNPVLRRKALDALRELRSDKGVEAAIRFADDPDERLREAVADYFEDVPDERGNAALMKLAYDESGEVAEAAVDAIGERDDPQAIAALEEVYLKSENPWVAFTAGRNRQSKGDSATLQTGVSRWRRLTTDPDPDRRQIAVWGLLRFSNEADVELVRSLKDDPDRGVRRAVNRTLSEWGVEE